MIWSELYKLYIIIAYWITVLHCRLLERYGSCIHRRRKVCKTVWSIKGVRRQRRQGDGAPFIENFWIFDLKCPVLVHPEWHFCQEMLAGYSDYNTMFAGQIGVLKRKWANQHGNGRINRHSPHEVKGSVQ